MYDEEQLAGSGPSNLSMQKEFKPRTKLQRLGDLKKSLESKLVEVNEVIRLLESNPEFAKIQDALEKVGKI